MRQSIRAAQWELATWDEPDIFCVRMRHAESLKLLRIMRIEVTHGVALYFRRDSLDKYLECLRLSFPLCA